MAQKTYINGVFINEHTFNDGGSILKLSVPVDKIDDFASQLKVASVDGWTRLVITRLREPKISQKTGKPISTHSLSVDDWKPSQNAAKPHATAPKRYASPIDAADVPKPRSTSPASAQPNDDVPF